LGSETSLSLFHCASGEPQPFLPQRASRALSRDSAAFLAGLGPRLSRPPPRRLDPPFGHARPAPPCCLSSAPESPICLVNPQVDHTRASS